jgi:hypothetical protein
MTILRKYTLTNPVTGIVETEITVEEWYSPSSASGQRRGIILNIYKDQELVSLEMRNRREGYNLFKAEVSKLRQGATA